MRLVLNLGCGSKTSAHPEVVNGIASDFRTLSIGGMMTSEVCSGKEALQRGVQDALRFHKTGGHLQVTNGPKIPGQVTHAPVVATGGN